MFPVVVGDRGLGLPLFDAVIAADLLEEHLDGKRLDVTAGELTTVVAKHFQALVCGRRDRSADRPCPPT
jgi:hypothetical protein